MREYPTLIVMTAPSAEFIIAPITPNTTDTKKRTSHLNTINHQYSERGARPCVDAYLSKQDFTESDNVMTQHIMPQSGFKIIQTEAT